MTETPQQRRTSLGSFLVRLFIGLAIVTIILFTADLEQLSRVIRDIDPVWLIIAILVQGSAIFIWAARWETLLKIYAMPVHYFRLVKALYIGTFFNNLLPTSVGGDVYRSYQIVDERSQFPKSMLIAFAERLIGVIILACIGGFAFLFHLVSVQGISNVILTAIVILLGTLAAIVVLEPKIYLNIERRLFPAGGGPLLRLRRKITGALETFHAAGSLKWRVYILSLLVQVIGIVLYYCVGRALGVRISMWDYMAIVPVVVILTLVPISFNGLGLREGGLIFITTALGLRLSSSEAVALGLLIVGVTMVSSLIGAAFYVTGRNQPGPASLVVGAAEGKQEMLAEANTSKKRHIKVPVHTAFYAWAKDRATDRTVLDAGCGEGYGTAILAGTARHVTGIDTDAAQLAETAARHRLPNVTYLVADAQTTGLESASFDVVVTNALLEYLPDCDQFFDEAYRLLKPGGILICSTKNLDHSIKKRDGTPLYANHLQEYSASTLRAALEQRFADVEMYGLRAVGRSQQFILNRRALKVEALLVRLNIKERIPLSWRNAVRSRLTGVNEADIAPHDFEVSGDDVEAAFYVIGVGHKR